MGMRETLWSGLSKYRLKVRHETAVSVMQCHTGLQPCKILGS